MKNTIVQETVILPRRVYLLGKEAFVIMERDVVKVGRRNGMIVQMNHRVLRHEGYKTGVFSSICAGVSATGKVLAHAMLCALQFSLMFSFSFSVIYLLAEQIGI